MKALNLLIISLLVVNYACTVKETKPQTSEKTKVVLGIYETIRPDSLPVALIDTLTKYGLQDEKDNKQPAIGYVAKNELPGLLKAASFSTSVKILKTAYTVDTGHKYFGIVAVGPGFELDNSVIQKAVQVTYGVEIRFNMEGAKAWAQVTRKNTGKTVAFVIDDEIYALPYINAEIRSGVALIGGLESEEMAKKVAGRLNGAVD